MRRLHPAVSIAAVATLGLLYLPLLAVVIFSVNASRHGFVWRGFTLHWYQMLLRDEYVLELTRNTVVLALVSTAIATVVGTLLAIGMQRFPWPRPARFAMELVLQLPVVTPDIIFAAAMVVMFGSLRLVWSVFDPGLGTMIIGHVTFQIAFVALVVRGRLATLGHTLDEAGRDLYADRIFLFRTITLPLLLPGVVAGALLAFTLSLDDFVISFFTAGPTSTTLPIYIYASVRRGVSPEIHALSTLIVLVTVVLVLAVERATRYREE